jgi:hypothetical protein
LAVTVIPLAAGTVIKKFDAVFSASSVTDPPKAAFNFIEPAIMFPYAVYEPDDVNLITVFAPLVVIVGEPVVTPV